MPRVLVVEDHPIVRNGIKLLLAEVAGIASVGAAATGHEALEMAEAELWDVVLLDMVLPGIGGLEVLRQLRAGWPDLPVLAMSFHLEADFVRQCLEAGASGFIVKERLPDDVAPALQAVLTGGQFLSADVRDVLRPDAL